MTEDLNRKHSATLTEGQISTILYCLEHYLETNGGNSIVEFDNIFEELEGVIDNYYDVESCIIRGEDYADCVDKLVESMEEN